MKIMLNIQDDGNLLKEKLENQELDLERKRQRVNDLNHQISQQKQKAEKAEEDLRQQNEKVLNANNIAE